MNILKVAAVLGLLTAPYARAQESTPTDAGFACFENLPAPEFPKAALTANIDGTVYSSVHISPSGAIQKIDKETASAYRDGAKLLEPAVEAAIRSAKIRPECMGKTVSMVFRYHVYGSADPNSKISSKMEGNIMYIEGAGNQGKG